MPPPENAVALVTGGSRGIGAAIASRLTEDGYKVVTLGRTSGDVQADIGDAESVQAAFDKIRADHGPICVLVNNAGERRDGLTIRMSAEDWEAVVNTNLNGAFHCTRQALVCRRAARQPGAVQLRRREGRDAVADAHGRARDGPQGHHLQRGDAGRHRDRHDDGCRRQACGRRSRRPRRAARRGRPRRVVPLL